MRHDQKAQHLRRCLDKHLDNPKKKHDREGFRRGHDGSYTFHGGGGDDRYKVRQDRSGNVTVTNEESGKSYHLSAKRARKGVHIEGGAGNDHIVVERRNAKGAMEVSGGNGNDLISARGSNGSVDLHGGAGRDRLEGGNANDTIDGGRGSDRIRGDGGNDAMAGGRGRDMMLGGGGNDQLRGQQGADRVYGNGGDDFVQGGAGADRLEGGVGGDSIYADKKDVAIDAGHDRDADSSSPRRAPCARAGSAPAIVGSSTIPRSSTAGSQSTSSRSKLKAAKTSSRGRAPISA